jgi:hypothetical protein
LFGANGALAQNCTPIATAPFFVGNVNAIGGVPAATASAIAGTLGNVSTAFLSQQTSAFVVGARADQPDQASGGVWTREVGGHVATKSDTAVSTTVVSANPIVTGGVAAASSACTSRVEQNFAGVQAGTDIARLNSNGWNVHVGLTAGYLESQGRDIAQSIPPAINRNTGVPDLPSIGNIASSFQVPFIGGYAVATNGGFFADLTVRRELYNVSVNQPAINFNDQQFGARAWSVSAGAGYNLSLQDGWFVEPSGGIIWSRTQVDPLTLGGPVGVAVAGTLAINDIESLIGRGTVRVGRTFTSGDMSWTPFGSASVFHEFAPNVTSTFQTCTNCAFIGAFPAPLNVTTSTTRVGTFGQFSAGLAGQLVDSGWVGFVRGDYRVGSNIEGWTANAGLRYNFVAERAVATKMVVKAPRAVALPYNWTGFYFGGHLGIAQGRGHIDFVGTGTTVDPYIAGWLAGGQVGYNVQYGPYVVGVEVDASKTNANGTAACGSDAGRSPFDVIRFTSLFLTCQNALDWITMAAVRLGTTLPWSDRTLLYVKAGGAVARESVTVGCVFGANNLGVPRCLDPLNLFTGGFVGSEIKAGGMIGVGSEFGLTREWSAKAELNYIWFGHRDITAQPDGIRLNVGAGLAEAKIGLNYRFGQAYPAPVTKY